MTDSNSSQLACFYSNQRQDDLQNLIDHLLESACKDWSAPLPFHIESVVGPLGNEVLSTPGLCPDILQYLGPSFLGCKVFFSKSVYNPSNGFTIGSKGEAATSWDQLRKDLCRATLKHGGFLLISNGYSDASSSAGSRKLICQHAKNYQKKTRSCNKPGQHQSNDLVVANYRISSFVNDRKKNSRGPSGSKMARRTNTVRPLSSCTSSLGTRTNCRFRIIIKCEKDKGFYLHNTRRSTSIPIHTNHVRLDADQKTIPTRLLSPEILDTVRTLNSVHACKGIGRDVALKKHNTILSLQQIRYLQGFTTTNSCGPEFNDDSADSSLLSSADKLLGQLCASGSNYVCILQHSAISTVPLADQVTDHDQCSSLQKGSLIDSCIDENTGEGYLMSDTNNEMTQMIPLDGWDYQEMTAFAEEKRLAQKCTDEQQLLIGIAWVSRSAKRWFKLYPHVLFIDVTEDTNKESRPFLSVSVKDSSGQHHIILRAFLPNQRAWSFRWVFQSVMPKLLNSMHLQNVAMCLTDGDSQETSQLDAAIQKFFPQAKRRRCAYHMITKRWEKSAIKKKVPAGLSCTKSDRTSMMKLLRDWQYSWTDSQTETASEMKVSLALFLEYIQSETMSKYGTKEDIDEILKLTRESILPFEEYFSFHRFSNIRCYDARTTSGHEGTNLALKRGATSVRPNQSLETAAAVIEQKERNHDAQMNIKYANELVKNKLWIQSATSNKLIAMGESLIQEQMRFAQCGDMISSRVKTKNDVYQAVFHVAKKRSCGTTTTAERTGAERTPDTFFHPSSLSYTDQTGTRRSPIPIFHRVRIVYVSDGIMFCTCRYFERFGIPCRHILHVMACVNPQHRITHRDVSVVYWSSYGVYAHKSDPDCQGTTIKDLSSALSALSQIDIRGPKYPIETENVCICEAADLRYELVPREAADSILNWPTAEVKKAFKNNNTNHPQYEEIVFPQEYNDSTTSNCDETYDSSYKEELGHLTSQHGLPPFINSEPSKGNSYQQVIPYVKDLVKRIDNGGLHDKLTPKLLGALRLLEQELNSTEAEGSTPVGSFVSCHAPTHKRRKTSHSKWRSKNT